MVQTANTIWRDFEADGIPSSGDHDPKKSEIRTWGTWVEGIISAFTSGGGLVFTSKAALDAKLTPDADTLAWVIGDPVVENNGIYQKQGASGTGSWTRVSDLPFSFIIASDAGAGTPNAIQATTSIPVSASALIWMNVADTNTASPVTVSFNGGSALTIKTNSGNDIVAGGLAAGMIVMGVVSGSTFRLISDQSSAAILAAAEAAADRAEAAAALAGDGYIFPETLPSWSALDAAAAIEEASNISAASGGQVKLTAGRTYNVSKVALAAASKLTAIGAVIAVAGTLTGSDIDVTIGNFAQFDQLVITSPGTETNSDICQVGLWVKGDYLEVRSSTQRGGGGIVVNPQDTQIGYIKARNVDRPLHLYNTSVSAQTTGTRIGFLDVENYVRAFRPTFCSFSVGGIKAVGRSPNASKSPGHNTVLIVGCSDFEIGDIWSEDCGEHVVRFGTDGAYRIAQNWRIGRIFAIRSGGCPLKINPTFKKTIAGTVAVTAGSANLTGSGTAFTTDLRRSSNIRISDTGEIYRILEIASDTSATLDRNVTTTDASSALEVMEGVFDGEVASVIGVDVGDGSPEGNEELIRLTHAYGVKIGPSYAFRNGELTTAQSLVRVNDICDVEIASIGADGTAAGSIIIDGTSDVDGTNQFGGDIVDFRVLRLTGKSGGNDSIGVSTSFNLNRVSIHCDNHYGFAVNLLRWTAGTLTGPFNLTGTIAGSVPPSFVTPPNSDNFTIDLQYNNARAEGRGFGSRFTATYELLSAMFSAANAAPTGLFLNSSQGTPGEGNFTAGITGSRVGSSRKAWGIAGRQGSADDKEVGVSIFIGDSATTANEALLEAIHIHHLGALGVIDGITAPTARPGFAYTFVDAADGDYKIRFGDGTTKTITVDT